MIRRELIGAVAVVLGCGVPACRGQYQGTPAARVMDQKGKDAEENSHYAEALANFRKAIALDPNYADAYSEEINAETAVATEVLQKTANQNDPQTQRKAKAIIDEVARRQAKNFQKQGSLHPDKPIYVWALGQVYFEREPLKAEPFCRQATEVDARFGPGYECLAAIANLRGDDAGSAALWAKAAKVEPDSPTAALMHARTVKNDEAAYKAATEAMIRNFPGDPAAAEALYGYASDQKTDADKAKWFEQLRRQFPPEKFLYSEVGMQPLFEIYDRLDPPKARALVDDMVRLKPEDDDWKRYATYADAMATAEQEFTEGHAAAAVTALDSVKAPYNGYDIRRELLLNARALDASGRTKEAFKFLLGQYAKHPTDEVGTALETYGAKLGKSVPEVHAAVWEAMQSASTPAPPFTLPRFDNGKPVSLTDYRGHVVLIDFWFPGCGACRESFPYLENLRREYKDKGVVVLAINGNKGEEPFVLPFLRAQGYDFLPLKADVYWVGNVYHTWGYPTTLIIGKDGRQYFRPRPMSNLEQHSAELAIDALLAHPSGN